MSGLELAGFVLGILGPLEQSITLVNLLRNHLQSYKTNENNIKQLIPSLAQLQNDLQQLQNQLKQYHQVIPQNNYHSFKTHLIRMQNTFNKILLSLTTMEQSAKRRVIRFRKATTWANECRNIQLQINDAQHGLLQINSFLGQTAVVTNTIQGTEQTIQQDIQAIEKNIVKVMEINGASSSGDHFKPYFQKLPVSIGAKSNFDSTDSDGNPSTVEGKLKTILLRKSPASHANMFAIHGPGGVGKTTSMHMLSHDDDIRQIGRAHV